MARGLSTAELNTIRDTLAAGRRPKVVFTEAAGQVAGQVGQVTGLTDPAQSDDWVVVRFGRDELPFSPTDLALPQKGAPAGRRAAKRLPPAGPPAPEFKITREVPGRHAERPGAAATAGAPAGTGVPADGDGGSAPRGAGGAEPDGGGPDGSRAAAAGPGPAADPGPGRTTRRAGRAGRARPVPGLTVTLAYAEGEWTVAAHQGSRALAKPYVIRAAEALRMVGMLDVAGVQEAVEQIVAAERAAAEAQAQRLREQLAELEARLADLREAR